MKAVKYVEYILLLLLFYHLIITLTFTYYHITILPAVFDIFGNLAFLFLKVRGFNSISVVGKIFNGKISMFWNS